MKITAILILLGISCTPKYCFPLEFDDLIHINLTRRVIYKFNLNHETPPVLFKIAIGKMMDKKSITPTGLFTVTYKNNHPICSIPGFRPDTYGTRLIGTSAWGINHLKHVSIHGTNDPGCIGTCCSSGCIRMLNEDVEKLFDSVHVGDAILIEND